MNIKKLITSCLINGYYQPTLTERLFNYTSFTLSILALFVVLSALPSSISGEGEWEQPGSFTMMIPGEPITFVDIPVKKPRPKANKKNNLTNAELLTQEVVIPPPESSGTKKIRACWHKNIPRDMDPKNLVNPGFEMSALNLIGTKAEIKIEYIEKKEFNDLFTGLEKGECDLIMGGLSRTDERDEKFRSSHNLGRGGVGIATRSKLEEFEPQI